MNCALITWKTNRIIGRKDPLDYLQERIDLADEGVVRERLASHLIPFELLSEAHYENLVGPDLKAKLSIDFNRFLRSRAELVVKAISYLAEGKNVSLEVIWG